MHWERKNVRRSFLRMLGGSGNNARMPCDPNAASKAQRKPDFYNICPCSKDIEWPRVEDFMKFLYVFMKVVKVIVRWEPQVNEPVAIFFLRGMVERTLDWYLGTRGLRSVDLFGSGEHELFFWAFHC